MSKEVVYNKKRYLDKKDFVNNWRIMLFWVEKYALVFFFAVVFLVLLLTKWAGRKTQESVFALFSFFLWCFLYCKYFHVHVYLNVG